VATLAIEPAHVAAQPAPVDKIEPALEFDDEQDQHLLVWVEDRGAGNRLHAKRVRSNGLPVGGATGGDWELTGDTADPAAGPPKGDQRQPALADGLVVWSEKLPGGTDHDLFAQRLFTNGRANGRPVMIAGGPGNQMHPSVVGSGRSGEWLVVWSEDTTDAGDILGVRISAALTQRSNVFEVAKGPGTAEDPTISRDLLTADAFLVLFTDDRSGNRDIWGTRVTSAGLPRGGPVGGAFAIVTSQENDYAPRLASFTAPNSRITGPAVRDPGGSPRHILLWTRDSLTDGPDVMAQRLFSNGLPQGTEYVLAGGAGAQRNPTQASRGLVAWETDTAGTFDILGVEVEANGFARRSVRPLVVD
jgi:hypothetical protein